MSRKRRKQRNARHRQAREARAFASTPMGEAVASLNAAFSALFDSLDEGEAMVQQDLVDLEEERSKVAKSLQEVAAKLGEEVTALEVTVSRGIKRAGDIHQLYALQLRVDEKRREHPELFDKDEAGRLNKRLNSVLGELWDQVPAELKTGMRPHIRPGRWLHRRKKTKSDGPKRWWQSACISGLSKIGLSKLDLENPEQVDQPAARAA